MKTTFEPEMLDKLFDGLVNVNVILDRVSDDELIQITEKIACYTFAIAKMVDYQSAKNVLEAISRMLDRIENPTLIDIIDG